MKFKAGLYEISYDDQPEIEYSEMTSEEAQEEYDRLVRIHKGGVTFQWLADSVEDYQLSQSKVLH